MITCVSYDISVDAEETGHVSCTGFRDIMHLFQFAASAHGCSNPFGYRHLKLRGHLQVVSAMIRLKPSMGYF